MRRWRASKGRLKFYLPGASSPPTPKDQPALLWPVSGAGVPLADAGDARLVAFRPADGGPTRLAVVVGDPGAALLCRGRDDRLRGAIRRMAGEGAGVLLHLVRESRGIGLGPDEDRFRAAAAMLRHLGIGRVRLLTDAPGRVAAAGGVRDRGRLARDGRPHRRRATAARPLAPRLSSRWLLRARVRR